MSVNQISNITTEHEEHDYNGDIKRKKNNKLTDNWKKSEARHRTN